MKTAIKYLLVLPALSLCTIPGHAIAYEQTMSSVVREEQQRVEVDVADLPEKVKASVGHNTELAWTILKAYLTTNPDKTTFYELYVQKPDGETWMKVDKEGKVLN